MNRTQLLFLVHGLLGFALHGIAEDVFHQWTDLKGRTITARFVKTDDNAVTVRLQGTQSMIRSTDLSPQSQAKLRAILFIGTPDEVLLSLRTGQGAKKEERNDFLDWTDKKGRSIRARIVKFVGDNLTVELEGAIHELPLAQLNAESQKLAQSLAEESSRPGPQAVVGKDEPQEWKDVNGRAIRARFIKLVSETLTIEMNGQPFDLPIASLSPDSQALARQLASDVKPPPDKTPQEKPVDEQIAKAMENGPPDQAEITLALNQALEYFRTLAAKDEEGLFYPPIRRRKVIGYSDKKVMYRKIVVQIPVHEWTTITKEVVRNVKVGDSGAVTVKKKVKVPVRVRGKQTGTRPQNRLVRDKNGTIERIHKVAKYGPGGTVEWKSGQLGQNALVIYALIKSGVDPFDELISRPLETFSYLYNTFGLPDSTWDLAWSICAFASSGQEEHRELASQMAAKLAGAQVKSGQAAGLWGPVGLDTELLGAILSANADTGAEYLRFKEKFDEKKKEYDENKMKEALELIRRTNNLKGRYTMMAKDSSVYFRVILKDKGFSETAGQVFNLIAFPLYLYNQTTVDLETTALVLHALSVASTKGVLPEETTTLRPKGSRQTLGKSRTLPQVLVSAANAIAKGQFKDGSFHQLNFHQPVNDFDKSLLIRGVPADPSTFPKLESPTTIASAAQGFATLNAFAAIAGEQAASRYTRNFQAATARVEEDLPTALFVDRKQTASSSTFGPYDLAFNVFGQKPSDSLVKLVAPVTRFLIDGQRPDGSWRNTNKVQSLLSSSMRVRSKVIPAYGAKNFDWAQAWALYPKWDYTHYRIWPGIVPTSYAMLALSQAMEYAPEPKEVSTTEESLPQDEIPPTEKQDQPEDPPDPKPAPQSLLKPAPNSPDEPLAKRMSVAKGVDFIDRASLHWQSSRKCVTCHTNCAYLMVRARLEADPAPYNSVRTFFEQYVDGWSKEKPEPQGIVVTAAALAIDDASKGKLTQVTQTAFDEAWDIQRDDGSWDWLKCGWGPFESDDHYGVTLAAIAAAKAPDDYAKTNKATAGLAKLRSWLENHPPRLLHQKAMMLWLGKELPEWVKNEDCQRWQKELLGLELPGGGWATAGLGDWKRKDGSEQTLDKADGYGTGFVMFALRQSGLQPSHPAIRRGIGWLKTHQRESGRWFTRSPYKDGRHYISHAGTAFALLALAECGEL